MTFGAPLALWGLALLLGPVFVHLLSRRTTRRQAFPSLRLLDASRVPPVSRRTLDDRALLLLRVLLVLLAVLAAAQPRWSMATMPSTQPSARVVILDTSASMTRRVAADAAREPRSLLAVARARADSLVNSARLALRIDTHDPAAALPAAAGWLSDAGGGELVVLYDGQYAVLHPSDVQMLPEPISVRVEVVGVATDRVAAREDTLRVAVHGVGADEDFAWLRARVEALEPDVQFVRADPLLGDPDPLDTLRHLTTYTGLADDPLVQETRRGAAPRSGRADVGAWWAVRDARDSIVLLLREGEALEVQPVTAPRDLETAALIAAAVARFCGHRHIPRHEYEQRVVDSAGLAALQRVAETVPMRASVAVSDTRLARLLWCLALLALGVEAYVRRRVAPRTVTVEAGA